METLPLKLVLFEDPEASERLNHLGVEVFSEAEIGVAVDRWAEAGIINAPRGDTRSRKPRCRTAMQRSGLG